MSLLMDYHKYRDLIKIKDDLGKKFIWCVIRNKFLVLQPEEMVRQLILLSFIEDKIYPKNRIQVEKMFVLNGLKKRYDIIVFAKNMSPLLMVECKSPKVTITQKTIDQITAYNYHVIAPYLLLSNGITTICLSIDQKNNGWDFMDNLPAYQ